MDNTQLQALAAELAAELGGGGIIPYLGPGMLALCESPGVPATPTELAARLTARASVPHKIRTKVTQAAQFIENFKHRKTLVGLMNDAYATLPAPSPLHLLLAGSGAPLIVDAWYDGAMAVALRQQRPDGDWGQVQGLSQSEHFGHWTAAYAADGGALDAWDTADEIPAAWTTLLYRPLGGRQPAANYLISDTDFVEVLTEIDIQTPIPRAVQAIRSGRGFLFLGCRFDDQLVRSFARQIMKRSGGRHRALIPGELTRMELRFLEEQGIERIDLDLSTLAAALTAAPQPALAA